MSSDAGRYETLPTEYDNHLPARLSQERAAAHRAGVVPAEIPSAAFDALAATGVRMVFVVVGGDRLFAAPREQGGEHISHAVLADGGTVLAAGEFEIGFDGGAMLVSELNNMSGHYRPAKSALTLARAAFESAGIGVRSCGITSYDWGAP